MWIRERGKAAADFRSKLAEDFDKQLEEVNKTMHEHELARFWEDGLLARLEDNELEAETDPDAKQKRKAQLENERREREHRVKERWEKRKQGNTRGQQILQRFEDHWYKAQSESPAASASKDIPTQHKQTAGSPTQLPVGM